MGRLSCRSPMSSASSGRISGRGHDLCERRTERAPPKRGSRDPEAPREVRVEEREGMTKRLAGGRMQKAVNSGANVAMLEIRRLPADARGRRKDRSEAFFVFITAAV
jgi:hypothetical protein